MSVTSPDKPAAASGIKTFSYNKPEPLSGDKMIVELAKSRMIRGRVQVVRSGGENNLHSHDGMDGFWMVLQGRVKFYGPGDEVIGEFGKLEGILLPAGNAYWFESADETVDLELLQMSAFDPRVPTRRVDREPLRLDPAQVEVVDIARAVGAAPASGKGENALQKYICGDCDYEYDPAIGDPTQGIAPGTSFDDLPDTWTCPECGVTKAEFYPVIESN
ncbi:MAG: rubredoxin/mannose-6-phosphate isomerase-like protein (cupin superfamily) [Alphaproteobacteria bacterium]|jgi:rubredoxin/mannose-6-phosphate isomerase-like protein (cupin superfamily)